MFSIHSSPIGELGTKNTGGMSVYIRELARHLGTFGHRVDIYTRLNGTPHNQIIDLYDNVRLIHLSAGSNGHVHKLALYYYLSDFLRALERFKNQQALCYDLIHSHYWLSGRLGSWVQDRWNIPHAVMFHTLGLVKNNAGVADREPDLRVATEKKLARSCQLILAGKGKICSGTTTHRLKKSVSFPVVSIWIFSVPWTRPRPDTVWALRPTAPFCCMSADSIRSRASTDCWRQWLTSNTTNSCGW